MADKPSDVHPLTAKFLGREMYLCITRPVRGPGITDEKLTEHLKHQVKLEKDGIMFAAGPLYSRESDKPEAGMFVIRAKSFDEAEAIVRQDPLHMAGLRKYTLQKWRVNEGSYTVTVNYSDQSVTIG
jgi:uncharacterized protein YciI